MKKIFDNFVLVFILFMPFLYLYISYGVKIDIPLESLGTLLFSIFFFICFIYLYINKIGRKILNVFIIYLLLAIAYLAINKIDIISGITNILSIFYLPVFMLFFSNYENKWINKKFVSYLYLIITTILTISFICRFNVQLELQYKKGFIGLFYNANVLSPILVILMPIALSFAYNSKSYIVKGIFYITTIISLYMVGTKTVLIGLAIYVLYLLVDYFKKKPHVALIAATVLSATVVILPIVPQYQNFRTERIYNAVQSETVLDNPSLIDKYVFGYRIAKSKDTTNLFFHSRLDTILFGRECVSVEIDLLDIVFTIGVLGFIVYLFMMVSIFRKNRLKGIYNLIFIIMIFASCFQGNIFTNYLVYIYLAVICLLSNTKEDNKKNILLVSNMYPRQNDSYGIFVKNVEDLLDDNYHVDRVVIFKHNNVIAKLIAYIYLHVATIIKMTFNNYDFIYIHYVSHSSLGAVIGYFLSKNTKLVFNVHGNDVVADTDADLKNIERSKNYLRYAYKVVVPSTYYKDVIRDEYNVEEKNIVVYPSGGIDVDLFKEIDMKESKKLLDLDEKTKYIGYVSRIETDKGYDTFVEAINVLKDNKKFKDYKYILLGFGSEEDKLEALIKKYKLEDYIIRPHGINHVDLPYLYSSLEMFVFPTRRKSESLGLVGLEAMACGVVTVTSDAKGPKSYIVNGKNGYTFKQDDYNDLVEVITKVSKLKKEDINKIKKAARKKAEEYSSDNTKDVLKKIFK